MQAHRIDLTENLGLDILAYVDIFYTKLHPIIK